MSYMNRRGLLLAAGAAFVAPRAMAEELTCGAGEFKKFGFFGEADTCVSHSPEVLALLELADNEPEPEEVPLPPELVDSWDIPSDTTEPPADTAIASVVRPKSRPNGLAKLVARARKPRQPKPQTKTVAIAPKQQPRVTAPAVRTKPTKGVRYIHATSRRDGKTHRVPYFADGQYIDDNNGDVNQLLCDWRNGATVDMQRGVLDFQWRLRQQLDVSEPFFIVSGYRTPQTNATLRAKSNGGVAKRSLHMDGKALDLRLGSRTPVQLFRAAWALGMGGTSPYSDGNFTHIDCGQRRTWGAGKRYV